jgi:hypothetical protein
MSPVSAFLAAVLLAPAGSPVERAAEQILIHQTDDGAIVMGALPAKRSHLIPYCANFAARGLVAAYGETGEARYLDAAKHWAAWYETHMNVDGTVDDFNGSPGAWTPTGDCDSTDSYAATYLDLVLAIHRASPHREWLRAKLPSARQAVAAIRLTLQPNGLTLAKPKWPLMYVMDNTETAGGLRAAEAIGRELGEAVFQQETGAMADRMEHTVLCELWDDARQAYSIGLKASGAKIASKPAWYPYLMANLMAVGWLPPSERHRALLVRLKAGFPGEIPPAVHSENELDHLVWWGFAAQGAGDQELSADIASKLAGFDAAVKQFGNPGLLGHLCRLLARHERTAAAHR